VVRLVEFWVEFSLTPQQVEEEGRVDHHHHQHGHEHDHHEHERDHHARERAHHEHGRDHASQSTAVTLATRAANVLAQAEDMIIFNGFGAFSTPLFSNVRWRPNGQPSDFGLLNVIPAVLPNFPVQPLPAAQVIPVQQLTAPAGAPALPPYTYLENTFLAVAEGYSQLMGNGQYGPFALTLQQIPYADSYSPLANTLITTADRIHPLMTAGFWDSGTLDAPGYQAAILAAAAAANPPAGTAAPVAAANAAASFAVNYGASLSVAAATGALAATNNGEGNAATAQTDGQNAAFAAAGAIPGYPNPLAAAARIAVAPTPLPNFYGSLVSLGGNTMDLVRGVDATAGFMQQDTDGSYRFRVLERMGLRIKNHNALVRLEFD
jgi:uncharacterized linocin/CFP29 family protein